MRILFAISTILLTVSAIADSCTYDFECPGTESCVRGSCSSPDAEKILNMSIGVFVFVMLCISSALLTLIIWCIVLSIRRIRGRRQQALIVRW